MKTYSFVDEVYKDESPVNTVHAIKQLLRDNGIETEEIWMPTSVPYCSAVRVNVLGTTFGTNGKGLSPELALASGYGELMERLQLGYITGGMTQKDGNYCVNDGQSRRLPARQLLDSSRRLYEQIARRLETFTGEHMDADRVLLQYADGEGMVQTAPYYNLTKGAAEYFPSEIRKRIYNANGCAAGNSMEEAIVQGISEIVERNHQMRIIAEELTPPDVPEEVLRNYKTAYEIISYVRSKGYKVLVKDCSLGTKFPVLCVCFIDERTGRYHTHFGACPVFEIALARALTESFQGRDIDNITIYDTFLSSREEACSARNIANEMGVGAGEKQLSFFVGTPKYPYNPDAGFRGTTNKQLLQECVEYFTDLGYEILIRDGSCMGFNTYQIIIPGYSELFIHRLQEKQDELKFLPYAVKTLRDPAAAGMEAIMGFLMHMSRINTLDQTVSGVHGFSASARLSTTMTARQDMGFMALSMAYVYYMLGRKKETLNALNNALTIPEFGKQEWLVCLKKYLTLKQRGMEDGYIRSVLEMFHSKQTVEQLLAAVQSGKNPLERYIISCKGQCDEACPLYKVCCQKRVLELSDLINEKTKQLSFEEFAGRLQVLLQ